MIIIWSTINIINIVINLVNNNNMVWRARRPLPCALRRLANFALGHERCAPVHRHHHHVLGLCLSLHRM